MFNNQNNEEKKLDWMYKGPNSMVEREEYLLGRSVDKTLEQLNEEEKQKQQGIIATPKNRVEHECIPPSIRDFNKVVQAEQVDLSTKLQEDPLVAIKKREEESRRQFLQNPVQLKKLQKAIKAQQAKKKKKKKKKSKHLSDSESDLEVKLAEKLLGKKNKKTSKDERDLDTILIHKYEAFKDKLTESDMQDILNGKVSDSDDSEDEVSRKKSRKKRQDSDEESEDDTKRHNKHKDQRIVNKREDYRRENRKRESGDDYSKKRSKEYETRKHNLYSSHSQEFHRNTQAFRNRSPPKFKSKSKDKRKSDSDTGSESEKEGRSKHYQEKYDSDDSESGKKRKINYGLVNSDGKKLSLFKKHNTDRKDTKSKAAKVPEPPPQIQKHRAKRLTEEEKEKLRKEMMENAIWRDRERSHNVKKYRETEEKERKDQDFDSDFVHKQLLKSAHSSSVESRIKSNLNNIQRSSRDMDRNFSKR